MNSEDEIKNNHPENSLKKEDIGDEKINQTVNSNPVKIFIRGLYQKLWIRVSYLTLVLLITIINLTLSWIVFHDILIQQPGLVYDRSSKEIITALLALNILELLFFCLDTILWLNIFSNDPEAWFCMDVANCLNIFLSELPLGVLNAYVSACHESSLSTSMLVKASIILCYMVVRFLTFTTVYLLETTEDSYVNIDKFIGSPKKTDQLQEEKQGILLSLNRKGIGARCVDIVRAKNLRRFWLVIRIFIIAGFFLMLVTNILIFKFTFVQTYRGFLEWRRVVPSSAGSLEDMMAERYFHDVEIFMKETELTSKKWLHLVSLEKLMQLQTKGITEQIGLSYIRTQSGEYCIFSQLLTYNNRTTETAMTCWSVLEMDSFKETACEDVFAGNEGTSGLVRLKSMKISFIYDPPSPGRHLGVVYYNATRTNINGTVFLNTPVKLEYFRNTIAHTVAQANDGDDDIARSHDGWTSGPFRPVDLYLSDGDQYIKYDVDTGDLIPIREVWRTGFALCPSTAPTGPVRMT
ncbi:hypothetical protein EG68_01815 [Paragonimus skrjabini miyazakii]|uniref:Uncharacterized protein n=1 Tax=Paragonimus skrjabini miyazakii TaxID=59628 RepID=A0A8S9Z641_9TREM|nr:hypothetical protein EG68_01815 [Paragonimus skrjabini miyazakii]